ncbi:hypothetical protein EYD10_02875, partial [Varanus komodoensis]
SAAFGKKVRRETSDAPGKGCAKGAPERALLLVEVNPGSMCEFSMKLEKNSGEKTNVNKNHICSRYADDTTLMTESEEELKSLLMRVKEESAKVSLKLNIKKTKIMASGPLTSWQIDGEEMEVVTDFIFLGSKITTDGDCSQVIKRRLLLGRKAMANLDSTLKSRDITLPTKVCIVKAMVFPVAVYGKLEHKEG